MDRNQRLLAIIAAAAVVFVGFVAAAGVGGFVYYRYTRSPRYALARVEKAIAERDLLLFETYVDVDGVATSLVDGMLTVMASERPRRPGDTWVQLGEAVGRGILGLMGPRLREKVAADIRDGVRTGRTPDGRSVAVEGLERLEVEGEVATARYRIAFDGRPVTVTLRLTRHQRGWQVIAVENAEELYRRAMATS